MTRIKALEGKTIVKAERGGDAYADQANFGLQLEFSDGTSFCIDACADSEIECDGVLFLDSEDGRPRKLWKSRHDV